MSAYTKSALSFLRKPLAIAVLAGTATAACAAPGTAPVTEADVLAAQQAWGNALVQISKDFEQGGIDQARTTAQSVIDAAYGYNLGPVLFKPTLTSVPQTFRTTAEGALAYFVGHDDDFPNDSGFALKGWRSVEVDNAALFIDGNTAMSMGNVSITDKDGNVTTVDKTWGYTRDSEGALRIVLHHSSLPYQP
ncbi:MAG: phosphoribosyl-AMP cyclohydrolase [Alcanivorax sp.]|nr:phosphoribosyl-AMP cyclohydrolase [Alcanivorax sp.]